jgi:hypothetical protein
MRSLPEADKSKRKYLKDNHAEVVDVKFQNEYSIPTLAIQ